MAIIGIGIDIIRISRIAETLERHGNRFMKRVYHPCEVEFANKRRKSAEFLAGCFAVKEAALKALGDFPGRGIAWPSIFITHEPTGKPVIHFEDKALNLCNEKGMQKAHVSISHDGDIAIAQVILED